ncbi:MAG: hypothetical protein ABEK01_02855 [Candidatus Nanohaloarchaea archaeon]
MSLAGFLREAAVRVSAEISFRFSRYSMDLSRSASAAYMAAISLASVVVKGSELLAE